HYAQRAQARQLSPSDLAFFRARDIFHLSKHCTFFERPRLVCLRDFFEALLALTPSRKRTKALSE
ncbi:MAG: hypothetical protein ACK4P1_08350, partial [Aggregatilineales bacterium]